MIKIDVISGFLGAGKTTLIKKMLQEKLHNEKIVIIENEFGEIGIDGSILKISGLEIKEINSGCICCSLVGDFGNAIEEVVTRLKPDRIIIEPSGVGKLSDVIKACRTHKLKYLFEINILAAVVDVLKFQIYINNFGEFFENQIKHARTIFLSRTQNIDEKKVESIAASIRKINSSSNIVTTPWDKLTAEQIVAVSEQDARIALENQMPIRNAVVLKRHKDGCNCGCHCKEKHEHKADEVFDVWGVETPKVFDEGKLKKLILRLESKKDFGMVLRGKGILQVGCDKWIQFDYVHGETQINASSADYTGRICIIGSGLKKDALHKLFEL
ncbi:CobW family GTP-binding protein [Pseudobacteroides cellulosolvens]|uniref:Cobalamin synthesis protein P47K n=1 Tax=Pseudobacteroides cellulosolvens ATCC 35603 = DSM 2933 TaxID=398512 RepID=A0A0L6JI31_9FIRM|nr:GTP-binding protein [Pseudobacteroides cellulosolvens]KNY25353.1 cobalamin synthesis protein P47K [Pseudobacteroides cellulosolvens ATCC 35603 = DSM 2933]